MSLLFAHVEAVFAPFEVLPLLLAAGLYAKRSVTLAERGRPVPLWRQLCFAGGLLTIAVALVSPIAHIGEELVIAHMVEHLLLGDLATLLLVLGLTGPLLQPILAIPVFDRLRTLAHPAGCLPALGAQLLLLARPGPLRRRLWRRAPCTCSSTPASSSSAA